MFHPIIGKLPDMRIIVKCCKQAYTTIYNILNQLPCHKLIFVDAQESYVTKSLLGVITHLQKRHDPFLFGPGF